MYSIRIIYASAGGHAKYVANRLMESLVRASVSMTIAIDKKSAADCRAADLLDADLLILVFADADGVEHLNADMQSLLFGRAGKIDFDERSIACVGLSSNRITAEAITREVETFVADRNGCLFTSPLILSGKDLYAYDRDIDQWTDTCVTRLLRQFELVRMRRSFNIFD